MRRDDLRRQSQNVGGWRFLGHCRSFHGERLSPYRIGPGRFAMDIWQDKKLFSNMTNKQAADQELDITSEVCPMTFVRTRLALDRMTPGQTLLVRLRGDEPLRNVPRTAREQGHEVLSQETGSDGITRLLLRRGG